MSDHLTVTDPTEALDRLAGCATPYIVGVRHHSAACAAAMPAILEALAPEILFIELPTELETWLSWLGHPDLEAPVALASVSRDSANLGFYPFADFSPELAALRWARGHSIPVRAFDLPMEDRDGALDQGMEPLVKEGDHRSILEALLARADAANTEALWDQMVEAPAVGAQGEAVRRAGLMVGWMLRLDAASSQGLSRFDLRREAHMRSLLAEAGIYSPKPSQRAACVVGAFHACALLPEPLLWKPLEGPSRGDRAKEDRSVVTSLISYSYELLDSRSGYPAGIRDPMWQQSVWSASCQGTPMDLVLTEAVVGICKRVRAAGHVAGIPDAKEAVRMALDLAVLRGLPAPGRREMLESIQSALGQGEMLGRGRVLARAMEQVLVGRRRGKLAPGTPRSGLAPHVEELLKSLRLPGPESESAEAVTKRLEPIRSALDRKRVVVFHRLNACGIPYAKFIESDAYGRADTVGQKWSTQWTPSTEAMLDLAGIRGVTLEQAALGALVLEAKRLEDEEKYTTGARLRAAADAGECGLVGLAKERLLDLMGPFLNEAKLTELLDAYYLMERIKRGHIPGLPVPSEEPSSHDDMPLFEMPEEVSQNKLLAAGLRALEGLAGSEDINDARAMVELIQLFDGQQEEGGLGMGRLGWALDTLARDGSPLMMGAAGAARVMLGRDSSLSFGRTMGSWVDGASHGEANRSLSGRLRGALAVALPLFEASPDFIQDLLDRVEALADDDFLHRLPALRSGFDGLSPAARDRLLEVLAERFPPENSSLTGRLDLVLEHDPEDLARFAEADRTGRLAALAFDGSLLLEGPLQAPSGATHGEKDIKGQPPKPPVDALLSPFDRWRLILGRQREHLAPGAARVARALDELYGSGRGEGSRGTIGEGGGREAAFPSTREWSEELEALFGEEVREEVLGKALVQGRSAAAFELDPEGVTPSVELLEQVLSLKGGLPESQLGRLRRLVERVVEPQVRELAIRVRPALTGLTTPRPTRRPGGPLDLRRTISANLRTVRIRPDGTPQILPERLVFKTRSRRSLDWRIILCVDVSGSMEASVIYSAMMGAILSAMPAVSVHFLAFNTEVIDLSERVDDPLGLLLEVNVGGGTHIAKALRCARDLMTVPSRTMVLVVSDFEEGWPVGGLLAEVRAIVNAGAKPLGLAALDDAGKPRYSRGVAELVTGAGMAVAALTPLALAQWIGEKIRC